MTTTAIRGQDALLATVRSLVPQIRAAADEVERERRLPASLLEALKAAGLFRLWLPRRIGGDEMDPVSVMRVVEAVACADGSVGWCVMVAAQCALLIPSVAEDTAVEVFGADDILAGGLAGGRAVAVDSGYLATGRWAFASGCMHATWMMGICQIMDGEQPRLLPDGTPERRRCLFRITDCEILDTWHTTGLRGTGSHDFAVSDIFVPVALAPLAGTVADGALWGGPLYKGPFIWPMRAAQALGIASHALDAFAELAATKKPFGVNEVLRDLPRVQAAVARAEAALGSVRTYLYETVGAIWDAICADQSEPAEDLRQAQLATAYTAEICREVVESMYQLAGATAIFTSSPLERCFRDVNTLMADQAVAPRLFESAGRAYLSRQPAPSAG